ncbi:MAG: tRNA (guanine-N(7)-)-methyltransferase non-catalytic subunit trm82 [Alyxoria varia]|nr:MAG: tRNA (guanine-N(7)-)-methyltransferase non-catalytic subunit trm82 [Alyxoria varia]
MLLSQQTTITHLTISTDNEHLAVATDNDKSVHVFSLFCWFGKHRLIRIVSHRMPKRLSAIAFHPTEPYVLCADKFGDVFAVSHKEESHASKFGTLKATAAFDGATASSKAEDNITDNSNPSKKRKTSQPAATELTVHSQRNLKALEQQKAQLARQKNQQGKSDDEDDASIINRKPILGHVSMLTDLVAAEINTMTDTDTHDDLSPTVLPVTRTYDVGFWLEDRRGLCDTIVSSRPYIFTADRDEHIRVSRGDLGETHIIEKFCLGHKQFVRKLLLPRNDILISGGGDDALYNWNWITGELNCKIDMKKDLARWREEHSASEDEIDKVLKENIAVSGLWAMPPLRTQSLEESEDVGFSLLVALEGTNLLLWYSLTANSGSEISAIKQQDFELSATLAPGNVIDVAVLPFNDVVGKDPAAARIFVSLDNLHEPCSTAVPHKSLYDKTAPGGKRLIELFFDGKEIKQVPYSEEAPFSADCDVLAPVIDIPDDESQIAKYLEPMRQLFYPSAGLRKRACGGDGEHSDVWR